MRCAHIFCGWSKRLKPNESSRVFSGHRLPDSEYVAKCRRADKPSSRNVKDLPCPKHSNLPSSYFSCSRFWRNPRWPIPNTARTSQNAGARSVMSSSPARRLPSTMRRHSAKSRERPSSIRTNSRSCCSSRTPICQACRSSDQKYRIWPNTSAHSGNRRDRRAAALTRHRSFPRRHGRDPGHRRAPGRRGPGSRHRRSRVPGANLGHLKSAS